MSITLILGLTITTAAKVNAEDNIEKYLPSDVAAFASINNFGGHYESFINSAFFKLAAEIHRQEKPKEESLEKKFQKAHEHPLFAIFNRKLVIGVIPPESKGKKPIFIILAQGNANASANFQSFIKEESQKDKVHIIGTETYRGISIITTIHPEKGKLEKRYTIAHENMLAHSNSQEKIRECYERMAGGAADFSLSPLYTEDKQSICKVWVNVEKLKIDLSKKHPRENKIPTLAKHLKKLRQAVAQTQSLYLSIKTGEKLELEITRTHKPGVSILPDFSMAEAFVSPHTLIFLNTNVPYDLVWHAVKHEAQHKHPRKWRKFEAKLDELFDWLSFENDVLPQIGPRTALLINADQKNPVKTLYPPTVALLVELKDKVDIVTPLNKFLRFVSKETKISKHLKFERNVKQDIPIQTVKLQGTPLDNLLKPAYASVGGIFAVATHPDLILQTLKSIKQGETSTSSLYGYVNFQTLAAFIQLNIPFIKSEALKKHKPFQPKKVQFLLKILRHFQTLSIKGHTRPDADILTIVLQ